MRQLHKHAEIGVASIACGLATANAERDCRIATKCAVFRVRDSCGTSPCWQTLGERNPSNPHGVYSWLFTGRTT